MSIVQKFSIPNPAGFATGAGLSLLILALLMGCAGSPRWNDSSRHPTNAQIQAVLGRLDSYVYYPAYEVYHNTAKDQYIFRSGGAWVTQDAPPRDVEVDALLVSPSVAMNFDDAPSRHHPVIMMMYPRNWGSDGSAVASAR